MRSGIYSGRPPTNRMVTIDKAQIERYLLLYVIWKPIREVYDNVYPLRMEHPNGEFGSQKLNDFADSLMNPILSKHALTDAVANAGKPVMNGNADDEYTVEVIKKSRVKHGVVQHLVKWAGYNNKHNTWIDLDEMECDDLIAS